MMNHRDAAKIAKSVSRDPRVKSSVIVYLTTQRVWPTDVRRSNKALAEIEAAGVARLVRRRVAQAQAA